MRAVRSGDGAVPSRSGSPARVKRPPGVLARAERASGARARPRSCLHLRERFTPSRGNPAACENRPSATTTRSAPWWRGFNLRGHVAAGNVARRPCRRVGSRAGHRLASLQPAGPRRSRGSRHRGPSPGAGKDRGPAWRGHDGRGRRPYGCRRSNRNPTRAAAARRASTYGQDGSRET